MLVAKKLVIKQSKKMNSIKSENHNKKKNK